MCAAYHQRQRLWRRVGGQGADAGRQIDPFQLNAPFILLSLVLFLVDYVVGRTRLLSDQEQIYVDDLRQNITTGREEE
jgi:hypothetical protein